MNLIVFNENKLHLQEHEQLIEDLHEMYKFKQRHKQIRSILCFYSIGDSNVVVACQKLADRS